MNSRILAPPRYGFAGLLGILLIFLFVVWPIVDAVEDLRALTLAAFTAIFISSVYAISNQRRVFIWALGLAALGLASTWLSHFIPHATLALTRVSLTTVFLSMIAWVVLRQVVGTDRVTRDTILGAACVYLLMGLAWASAYRVVYLLDSAAFQFPDGHVIGDVLGGYEFIYYSFVTLTTVGFGDVAPLSALARGLTTLEAVTGQLYIALLVARLVGLYVADSTTRGESGSESRGRGMFESTPGG